MSSAKTKLLTAGVDTILGGTGDDIINATGINATTGAAQKDLNAGDKIDGGAGTDTLNITFSATNNEMPAAGNIKNVEVINLTGANNLAKTIAGTPANAPAVAGAAQVAVYDLTTATATAEIQTVNFGDLTVTTAGTIVVGGVTVTLAVGDTGATLADNVVTALTADATFHANVSSYSVTGGVVTVNFKNSVASAALLDPNPIVVAAPATGAAAYSATAAVTSATGVIVATPQPANLTTVITVTVNGTQYSTNVATLTNQLSTTTATADTANATVLQNTRTAVKDLLTDVLGGTVTIGDGDNLNEVRLTSKFVGQALPSISVAQGTTSRSTPDTVDPFVVANVEKTGAEGALSQIISISVDDGAVANFAGTETFQLFIDGVSYGVTAIAAAATEANVATAIASAINAVLGTGVATTNGATVLATAPTAGTALPHMSIKLTTAANEGSITFAQVRANQDPLGTTTTSTTTAAAVSGADFAGAEQVWLVGGDSGKANLTVSAAQIAGLNKVTSLDNTIAFGATGVLALEGSSGKSTITGAAGGLTIAGSTGTLALTHAGTATTGVKALTLNMSGTSSFDVSAMTALTSVVSTGAGNVTVNPKALGTSLASITTGAGNDTVRINTTTVKENVASAIVAVNAVVDTGAGNDVIHVATTAAGTGNTTVDAGAGNDTIYVASVSTTGTSKIDAGADNDTVHLRASLGTYPNLTIDGGSGSDTLVIEAGSALTGTLNAVDYLRMNAALSNFEAVRFNTTVTNLDVSKLDIGSIGAITFNDGANTITEVAGQTLTLGGQAAVTATDFNPGYAEAFTGIAFIASGLDATAAGYKVGVNTTTVETVYGGSLNVITAVSAAQPSALTLKGSAATVTVAALGGAATAATLVGGVSDVGSLTVNLVSGYKKAATNGAAEVALASFNAGVIQDTSAVVYNQNLESLSSLKVNGSGSFAVDNSGSNVDLVSLTTIDVSGMTAIYDKVAVGATPSTVNKSVTTIFLNAFAAETVILGGARDTVNTTTSTVALTDTIIGFQLAAKADDADDVDLTRSDVLDFGTGAFVKFTTTATTLIGALTAAGLEAGANLVFHFGGDTYVYVDNLVNAAGGLDDTDLLVKLVGIYDLDLLVLNSGSANGVII